MLFSGERGTRLDGEPIEGKMGIRWANIHGAVIADRLFTAHSDERAQVAEMFVK